MAFPAVTTTTTKAELGVVECNKICCIQVLLCLSWGCATHHSVRLLSRDEPPPRTVAARSPRARAASYLAQRRHRPPSVLELCWVVFPLRAGVKIAAGAAGAAESSPPPVVGSRFRSAGRARTPGAIGGRGRGSAERGAFRCCSGGGGGRRSPRGSSRIEGPRRLDGGRVASAAKVVVLVGRHENVGVDGAGPGTRRRRSRCFRRYGAVPPTAPAARPGALVPPSFAGALGVTFSDRDDGGGEQNSEDLPGDVAAIVGRVLHHAGEGRRCERRREAGSATTYHFSSTNGSARTVRSPRT